MNNFENYIEIAVEKLLSYGPKLILAIITLIIGLWVIKFLIKALKKALESSNVEISLRKFLSNLISILLKILLIVSVASMIGIEVTSFIAILGAAGLAVGLALQGGLANFAGGVLILLFKPYKVGDYIDAQGYSGTVRDIQVFHTILKTPDNKTVIIPNGNLSNGSMINYSTEEKRRVDMTFSIGYSDDIKKAKEILNELIVNDSRILHNPEPAILLAELADSSVNFVVRVWCEKSDYWPIFHEMQEKVKLEFDKNKISIPFPQQDVHIYKH